MKVKMFTRMNTKHKGELNNSEFEAEVNQWLEQNPGIEIQSVQQSTGGGSMGPFVFFVTIWYQ